MTKFIKYFTCAAICIPFLSMQAQDSISNNQSLFKKALQNLSASLETNAQWYLNDKKTGNFEEEEHLRANSYLKLNYYFLEHFTAGVQVESYAPKALLNYDNLLDKEVALAQYFVNYKNKKIDATAGYFYEQFGSGLSLRLWEDTALGINNSIRGGNIVYTPFSFMELKALYGNQRRGLSTSKSNIAAFNANFDISKLTKWNDLNLSLGVSFVNRHQKFKTQDETNTERKAIPNDVYIIASRLNFTYKNFYSSLEYAFKSKDVRLNNFQPDVISFSENKLFDGSAYLLNLGYSKKGIGVNYTFRRLENMSFFANREDANLSLNQTSRGTINYIPALTKQHDYTLANIHVYQAQPGLYVNNFEFPYVNAGEIGNQIDVFYNIKKGTTLGGKYGTKLSANLAYWAALQTKVNDPDGIPYFSSDNLTYTSEFLNFKNKLFRDFNLEIKKKWSRKFSSIFTYINYYYNYNKLVEANGLEINAWLGIAESTYKFNKGKSLRLEAQHLATNDEARNWYGGTVEYFFNPRFGIYFNDSYNYEKSEYADNYKIHFFNLGGSYTKKATRIALNYGRQRGGLICVGGVCRPVSKNTGLTLNFTTSF